MRTSRCALDIKGAKQWKLEVQNTQKKNITRAHPYFTLLHVYWRPRVVIVLTIRSPPLRHHQHIVAWTEKHGGEWRRLTVSYIVAAPVIHMGRIFFISTWMSASQEDFSMADGITLPKWDLSVCIMAIPTNDMSIPNIGTNIYVSTVVGLAEW